MLLSCLCCLLVLACLVFVLPGKKLPVCGRRRRCGCGGRRSGRTAGRAAGLLRWALAEDLYEVGPKGALLAGWRYLFVRRCAATFFYAEARRNDAVEGISGLFVVALWPLVGRFVYAGIPCVRLSSLGLR